MANNKTVKTRVQHKRGTADNWKAAVNFVPLEGELIVYKTDDIINPSPRLKVGDGRTNVSELPFVSATPNGFYGECSTIATEADKIVYMDNFVLKIGTMVIIKFNYENTAENPTLQIIVPGSKEGDEALFKTDKIPLGVCSSVQMGNEKATNGWAAGAIQLLVYDGDKWVRNYWYNTDTNAELGHVYGICESQADETTKVVDLSNYSLKIGGIVAVKFTNSVPENATLYIGPVKSGEVYEGKHIYYKNIAITNNIIRAGDLATFMYDGEHYQLLSIDSGRVDNVLTVGSKTFDGSEAVKITASDLGLSQAMKFLGTSTTRISDGANTNPITIGEDSVEVTAGNVVLYDNYEYVWTGSAWELLGGDSSFKVIQDPIEDPTADGTSLTFIDTISQNTNGVINATKRTIPLTADAGSKSNEHLMTAQTIQAAIAAATPEIKYTNTTPIVNGIGSIKPGTTFNNVSIQDMLTQILYPYIKINVGSSITVVPTAQSYDVKSLPTLTSVTLNLVEKNSATNLSFNLWDVTKNSRIAGPLTEADIIDNKLTFVVNYSIDTTRDFEVRYTYTGEDGTTSQNDPITVGTFTITFTDPTLKTPTSNLDTNNYYAGQTATISKITAALSKLNSAEKITKLELYKNNVKVGNTIENPSFPYTFDNLQQTLTSSSKSTVNTNYKVKAYFYKRTGDDTTYYETDVDSENLTITFTYRPATISLSGVDSKYSISKFAPQSISSNTLTASFTEYSDKITSVKLFENNTEVETKTTSSYGTDVYNTELGTAMFDYNKSNICKDLTLTAKAYNNNTVVATTSQSITLSFYAPVCYGHVETTKSFNTITRSDLEGLAHKSNGMPTDNIINLSEQSRAMKFILAVPTSEATFSKAIDNGGKGDDNFSGFENSSSSTIKNIIFADGSTVEYQILIAEGGDKGAINYQFR